CLACATLVFAGLAITRIAAAQEHDDDHDHDHLHFSHPLITESPSPDTKLRLDFVSARTTDAGSDSENILQVEGEYAFGHAVSLAVVTPFVWLRFPGNTVSNFGDVELSLKGASMLFAERGVLFGGGLSTTLPTGSETKGIGGGHMVELEPFIDVAYKRDALELVTFLSTASTVNRRSGDEEERSLSLNGSVLYAVVPSVEALFEVSTTRALAGVDTGSWLTLMAPGVKVYPFPNRQFMFGASAGFGTGTIKTLRTILISGFYHF
ncbi:MAG TPA: hypothetical protein VM166_03050, partial [Gemmatimonadaceae bacterium]|nr:hypothetical protein [Gemmatimonadaceae bacterium]